MSLAWVQEAAVRGAAGDWRVASAPNVVATLLRHQEGRRAIALLSSRILPFQFSEADPMRRFRVFSRRGLRFYGEALRRGLREKDQLANDAVAALESAADTVGTTLRAHQGALLVCHNWTALHDRLEQALGRRSLLCFVE